MTVNEAYLIYFSPTHTSKQVAEAIVHGTGIKNILPINVTQQIADEIVIPAFNNLPYYMYNIIQLNDKNLSELQAIAFSFVLHFCVLL